MLEEGLLIQPSRGLYQLADAPLSSSHTLAGASRVVPHGVICLLSALQFHQLTDQVPHEVWILVGWKKWAPRHPAIPLRIVRATGESLTKGVEYHTIENVAVPITVPGKTVADAFKYRRKVGLEIAIRALRDCIRDRRATVDELWRYATIDRVHNVMHPYLEALR
jgi:predicted transcriptional regulator of viral defense system